MTLVDDKLSHIPAQDTHCIECTNKSPDSLHFAAGNALHPALLIKECGTVTTIEFCDVSYKNTQVNELILH